ncbi:phage tail protein [Paraburkholderia sp. D15]|uniref:gp53-like domain-containing protein n=1 Tax=Paraburkholderia sp. D15 TaxID=2880218 RepID=UPI0024791677|nr:phage tail protein [Paraburkholderia sp. D15]WGS50853.1 phage tail protein [Paraburkholderia sp. D15]
MIGSLINITDAGRAALVAPGNTGTSAHRIVEIGLGTGLFDAADRTLKKLPNELKRITTFGGENVAPDTIHVTLRDDTADQYALYGFGLYMENGVLFGAYCQKPEDGPIMEKSPAAMLLLSADMQFATIDAAQLVFGDANFTNPPATTERQGVVELATQAEVDAGVDDVRAITPRTAATRYAALTGAAFTGPVQAGALVGEADAQFYVKGASGANGRDAKIRLYGTFGNNADTGTRLAASIRAGFNGGNWGTEYLDFCLNYGAANDAQKDSLQARVLRLVAGGRALFNTAVDDGTNIAQFGGNVSTRGVHTFGFGSTVSWISNDPTVTYFRSNGHVSLGSEAAAGFLDLVAGGGQPRMRVTASGRVLFGKSDDDGENIAQFNGNTRTYGFAYAGAYGSVKAWMAADAGAGYFRTAGNASIGTEAPYGFTELLAGGTSLVKVLPSGRVLMGNTANDDGTNSLQVDGSARFNGTLSVGKNGAEGRILLGSNDGYFYANEKQAGFYSPTNGQFQYEFGNRNLTVQGNAVWHAGNLRNPWSTDNLANPWHAGNLPSPWHAGNLTPLDVAKGGTIFNDVVFADGKQLLLGEGNATRPSLTFVNDGAPDTGLFHIADGVFGITTNGVESVRFGTNKEVIFAGTPKAQTPAQFDSGPDLVNGEALQRALGSYSGARSYTPGSVVLTEKNIGQAIVVAASQGPQTWTTPELARLPIGAAFRVNNLSGYTVNFVQQNANDRFMSSFDGSGGSMSFQVPFGSEVTFIKYQPYTWLVVGTGADFLGPLFGSSLGSSGFQKLPSGMIFQWGNGVTSNGALTQTLPMTYPRSQLIGVSNATGGGNFLTNVYSLSQSQIIIYGYIANSAQGGATYGAGPINWFSLGF